MSGAGTAENGGDRRHHDREPPMVLRPLRLAASSFVITSMAIIALHLLLK
ncbi:MAG: hypothetical protein AB7V62_10480 [Thermoleophilia bacterium]